MSEPVSELATAQTLRYAEELRDLVGRERRQRHRAETALARLQSSYGATVRALATALELRDDGTGEHAQRVSTSALALARAVAPAEAGDPNLEFAFLLHDVGKIGVPDAVLLKPGPLDAAELAIMRQHPTLGETIVATLPDLSPTVALTVRHHHERWDGSGYPDGLAGLAIPLAARLFAVVDAYDAMTSDRPYRRALPVSQARRELAAGAGTQFDPELVAAFLALEAAA
jgi:ribonuclease P protein subunit RPR2